jgi:CubicO group peptidase (beta-lactamase class C family)
VSLLSAYGHKQLYPTKQAMTTDTVFDLASLTKVIATTTSLMLLVDTGKVTLDARVGRYFPAFTRGDRAEITLRHLLTHQSGLPAATAIGHYSGDVEQTVQRLAGVPLVARPGASYLYSDVGFVLLGALVQELQKRSLSDFAHQRVFAPLGMQSTSFQPAANLQGRIAPTERIAGRWLRGTVHDPRARAMGGVAGHAGLFSSAGDLATFARMMLNQGTHDGHHIVKPKAVQLFTAPQPVPKQRRALGWDLPERSTPSSFSPESYGHGGFTGTSLWVDPKRGLFVVFLSNRLHSGRRSNVIPTAKAIRDLVVRHAHDLSVVRPESGTSSEPSSK